MGRELSLWACIDYAVSGGHTFNLSPFIRSSIITTGAIKKKKEVCWRANKFTAGWTFLQIWLWWLNPPFWPDSDGQSCMTTVVHPQIPQAWLQYRTWTTPTLPQLYTYRHAGAPGVRNKKDRKSTNHLTPLKDKLIHDHVTQLAWKKKRRSLAFCNK